MIIIIAVGFYINCWVFDTKFAEVTIDWFAFLAGIFLMTEGTWKIVRSEKKFLPYQLLRVLRVFIGTNVFTIHLLQFMRY